MSKSIFSALIVTIILTLFPPVQTYANSNALFACGLLVILYTNHIDTYNRVKDEMYKEWVVGYILTAVIINTIIIGWALFLAEFMNALRGISTKGESTSVLIIWKVGMLFWIHFIGKSVSYGEYKNTQIEAQGAGG